MGKMSVSSGVLLLERWEWRLGVQGMSSLEELGSQMSDDCRGCGCSWFGCQ